MSSRPTMLCLLSALLFAGCNSAGKATLYIDNDSKTSYRVEIDGQRSLYVGQGKSAKRNLPFGEPIRIVVKKDGRVIFDETKQFERHTDGPAWRHFLLDPEGDTRYSLREFYYYTDLDKADKGKKSRAVRRVKNRKWVEIPKSATALQPVMFTSASSSDDETTRQCVVRYNR